MRRARHILERIGIVVAVSAIAVICLSSGTLAAIVGVITAAIVAVDMIAFEHAPRPAPRPNSEPPPPDKLDVDLTRRD